MKSNRTRYQKTVDREYKQLTIEQLTEQAVKFWGSDLKHEQGKCNRALEELKIRRQQDEAT